MLCLLWKGSVTFPQNVVKVVCVCECVCGGKKEMGKYLEGESATILLGNIPQLFAISFKPVLQ